MLDLKESAKLEVAKLRFGEELAFRIRSRRNSLLGLWLASRIGMADEAAAIHAREFAALSVDHPSDEALVRHVIRIGAKFGVPLSEHAIRTEMDRLGAIAAVEHGAGAPQAAKAA